MIIYAMQADSLSRFFAVTVTDSGAAWTPPDGALWTVRFGAPQMPAGWYDTIAETGGSTHAAVSISGNTLTVEIAEQALSAAGNNVLTVIAYTADGYQLAAWPFTLSVQAVPGLEAPTVTEYYNLLTEQVAQVLASVGSAQQYATQSAQSATTSQSWAVGGTGSRAGENTNNSQYWANQAAQSAQEAVGFRTMQGGAVLPIDGDVDLTQPYPTKTDASVSITSAENRIDSVTIHGFTTQDGEGDPSFDNERFIRNAGQLNKKIQIDGNSGIQESEAGTVVGTSRRFFLKVNDLPILATTEHGQILCDLLPTETANNLYSNDIKGIGVYHPRSESSSAICFRVPGCQTLEEMKRWLSENPITVCYRSTQEMQERYTGVIVEQEDNYYCKIVELQAPLHEGDTLKTNVLYNGAQKCVETHAKATVTVDGQNTLFTQGSGGYAVALLGASNGAVLCNVFSGLSAASGSVTIPASLFPASVTDLSSANAWARSQNVVIEYTLSTPAVYTSDPVQVNNPFGEYTVSGESNTTCAIYMEPIQDGGAALSADALSVPVNIGNASFDGTADITLAQMGAAEALPAGMIAEYAGASAPSGWLLCNGAAVSRTAYAALFAAIGTAYGAGDGSATFNLPDFRGRTAVGADSDNARGAKEGSKTHAMTEAQNGKHAHQALVSIPKSLTESNIVNGNHTRLAGLKSNAWDDSSVPYYSGMTTGIDYSGSSEPFSIMQPSLYVNYIIKT